MLRNIAKLNIA